MGLNTGNAESKKLNSDSCKYMKFLLTAQAVEASPVQCFACCVKTLRTTS